MMHFWSKFGKPHFIWFWLIARTNSQAQNGVNLDFQAQFDLEDHCQSPHKTIGILIKVFYISDPNLVILAWTVGELSHGQAHDWRTHRHTHTQATTIPEGQNWPRVKSEILPRFLELLTSFMRACVMMIKIILKKNSFLWSQNQASYHQKKNVHACTTPLLLLMKVFMLVTSK